MDFSPILAFVTLNLLQTSSVSLAAMTDDYDISDGGKKGMMVAAATMTKQKVVGEEGKGSKKIMG